MKVVEFYLIFFYLQPIYVGDGCVEYDYMKLKHDNDEKKKYFFLSIWNLVPKIRLS